MTICLDPNIRAILQKLGFTEDPFSDSIDTRFLCYTIQHRSIMTRILEEIQGYESFICISGEAGTGKSLLAMRLYQLLRFDKKYKAALYTDPQFSTFGSLYLALAYSFNLHIHKETAKKTEAFYEFIDITGNRGAKVILIIDNADTLVEEDFRSIIQLYRPRKPQEKIVRFVFFGRPSYLSNFPSTHFQQNIDYTNEEIQTLSPADSNALINFRCLIGGRSLLFSDKALEKLYDICKGNPRAIVRLGKSLLITIANKQKQFVDSDDIEFTLSLWENRLDSLFKSSRYDSDSNSITA